MPLHVLCSVLLLQEFCFLLQAFTTNICSVCCLVPVTSGTTCTGLHTPIRMPVLCVVFRLETGGEHPFAVPYPFGLICSPFLTDIHTFHLFACIPAPSKLCTLMATTLLVCDPNIPLLYIQFVCFCKVLMVRPLSLKSYCKCFA